MMPNRSQKENCHFARIMQLIMRKNHFMGLMVKIGFLNQGSFHRKRPLKNFVFYSLLLDLV